MGLLDKLRKALASIRSGREEPRPARVRMATPLGVRPLEERRVLNADFAAALVGPIAVDSAVFDHSAAPQSEVQPASTHEVLFVDARVQNWESLVAGVREGVDVVVIDQHSDGLSQIAHFFEQSALSQQFSTPVQVQPAQYSAIHIVSHGESGKLLLGSGEIGTEELSAFSKQLSVIGSSLSADGDILLYGCNVAAGDQGRAFLQTLANLTRADIAASEDLTGATFLEGDWELESAVGTVEHGVVFDLQARIGFAGVLSSNATVEIDANGDAVFSDSGVNADDVTISFSATHVFFTSAAGTITATGPANQDAANQVSVAFADITGGDIFVNTLDGDDVVIVAAGTDPVPVNLTIDAGADNDTIDFTGDVTFAAGRSLSASADALNVFANTDLVTSGSGAITFTADQMAIDATSTIGSAATVTLRQQTATRQIDLGTETVGKLSLTDDELDRITAGLLVQIGNSSSGTVTISSTITHGNHLSITTGGGMAINAGVTMATNRNLIASAVGAITLPNAASDVSASGTGTVLLTSDVSVVLGAGATVTTVDGDLTVDGDRGSAFAVAGGSDGVLINGAGAALRTTGAGSIFVSGRGGDDATVSVNSGVQTINGGAIQAQGTGNVQVTGVGGLSLANSIGVLVDDNSSITASGGDVTLHGTAIDRAAGSVNIGVLVDGGAIVSTTGEGDVSVTGFGGNGLFNGFGIAMDNGTISVVDGNVTLTGVAGDGGAVNVGVFMDNGASVVSTGTGPAAGLITIHGTGGTGTNNLVGVGIEDNASVTAMDAGISITGVAGSGTQDFNRGIALLRGATVISTGNSADTQDVTLHGTGGGGTASNAGVQIFGTGVGNSRVQVAGANLTVTGLGGAGSTTNNHGVVIDGGGRLVSTGTGAGAGNIEVVATGGTGSNDNRGFHMQDAGSAITAIDGGVTISGTATDATGTGHFGVSFGSGAQLQLTGAGEFSITGIAGSTAINAINIADGASLASAGAVNALVGDRIAIGTTTATINVGTNTLAIRQDAFGVAPTIGLGSADSATVLGLTDGELDRITAGTLAIGNASSGNISFTAGISPANVTTLRLETDGNILDNFSGTDVTVTNLTLIADYIGSAAEDIDTSTTGLITLTSTGVGTLGGVNLSSDTALSSAASRLVVSTAAGSSELVRLRTLQTFTVNGNLGTALDDLIIVADGNAAGIGIIQTSGTLLGDDVELATISGTAGSIGASGAAVSVQTAASGKLTLSTTGAGAAGNIFVTAANSLSTAATRLAVTTAAATTQTISLTTQGNFTVAGNLGHALDDLVISAQGSGGMTQTSGTLTGRNIDLATSAGDIGASGAAVVVQTNGGGTLGLVATGSDIFITSASNLVVDQIVTVANQQDTVQITTTGTATLTLTGANGYTGLSDGGDGGDDGDIIQLTSGGILTIQTTAITAESFTIVTSNDQVNLDVNITAHDGIEIDTFGGALADVGTPTISVGTVFDIDLAGGNGQIDGTVAGAGGITKRGTGTLTLTGPNTYQGTTAINAGTLVASHASALGTTAGTTSVASGATLRISNVAIGSEAVDLAGSLVGTGTASLAGAVTLSGAATLSATTGTDSLTLGGTVSGNFDLTLAGAGVLTFQAAVGGAGAGTAIGDGTGAAITITNTGTTQFQETVRTASGISQANTAGAVTFRENVTIAAGDTATTFNGNVVLDGLTFSSAGAVTIGNAGSDTLTISADPVEINTSAGNATLDINSATTLNQTLTVNVGTNTASTLDGAIGGTSGLVKTGAGTVTVTSASNNYAGTTDIQQGTLRLGNAAVLPNTTDVSISSGAFLDLAGFAETIDGLTGAGTVTNSHASTAATFTVGGNNQATATFSGTIQNGTAVTNFAKSGTGTQILSGTNTYTGTTAVNANGGTLLVNGSITGAGNVTVGNNATLGGSGSLAGAVTVNSGGRLSPGNSPGIITTGNLNLASGSIYTVEIDDDDSVGTGAAGGTAGVDYDQTVVIGTVTIGATAILNLSDLGSTAFNDFDVYTIINNNGTADAVSGVFGSLTGGVDLNGGTLANGDDFTFNGDTWRIYYNGGDGNDVILINRPAIGTFDVFVSNSTGTAGFDFSVFKNGDFITDVDFLTAGNQSGIYGVNAFATLTEAVVGVDAGRTVHVNSGTYTHTGTLLIQNAMTIDGQGKEGVSTTHIRRLGAPATEFDEAIRVEADNVTISDVRLGWVSQAASPNYFGYVLVLENRTNMSGATGGTLDPGGMVEGTTINNVFFGEGYSSAIVMEGTNLTEISDSIFTDNWGRAAIRDGTGLSVPPDGPTFGSVGTPNTNFLITRNEFREDHYRWGPISFGPQDLTAYHNSFSGVISFNYFANGLTSNFEPLGDKNYTITVTNNGITAITGIPGLAEFTGRGLVIDHNTFDWQDSNVTNSAGVYARPAGVYIDPTVTTNTNLVTIEDNIFNNFAYTGPQPGAVQPNWITGGKFGGALSFDGVDDFATFMDPAFSVGAAGSLSFWVNLRDVTSRSQLFEGPGDGGMEFQFRNNSGGQFYGRMDSGLPGDFAIQNGSAGAGALNTWTHLLYTWDFTTKQLHIFQNGAEVAYLAGSDFNISNWTTIVDTANRLMYVGRDPGDSTRYLDGSLDDIAWFNRALDVTGTDAATVSTIITSGVAAIGAHTNLVAHWDLDTTSGFTEADNVNGIVLTAYTATPTNDGPQFRPGQGMFGSGALEFDGIDDFATFQDSSFNVGAAGTLNMWVKFNDLTSRNTLFEGSTNGMEFAYRENTNGQFFGSPTRVPSVNNLAIQNGNAGALTDQWVNIQYTWNFNGGVGQEMHIYINGTEVGYLSAAFDASLTLWTSVLDTTTETMTMGKDSNSTGREFGGLIDEVAWFNTVLNSTQRAQLISGTVAAAQAGGGVFNTVGGGGNLVAYWDMNDAVGTTTVTGDGGTGITLNLQFDPPPPPPAPVSGYGVFTGGNAGIVINNNVFFNDEAGGVHGVSYADSDRAQALIDANNITGPTANPFFAGDQPGFVPDATPTLEEYYTIRFGSSAAYLSTEFVGPPVNPLTLTPHIGAYQDVPSVEGTEDIVISGQNGDDLLVVTFTGDNDGFFRLTLDVNGTPTFIGEFTFTDINSLTFNGFGGDDVMIVYQPTLANGSHFSVAGGLFFNGMTENNDGNALDSTPDATTGGDSLILLTLDGTVLDSATYLFGNETADGHQGTITLVDGVLSTVITYTGTEPIRDELSVNQRTFTYASTIGGGDETITVSNAGDTVEVIANLPFKPAVPSRTLNNLITSTLGASVSFNNPLTQLAINAGVGNDTVTISSVHTAYRAALDIQGDGGFDIVNLNSDLTLGSAVAGNTGNLNVESETIVVDSVANGSVAINTGAATVNAGTGGLGHVTLTAARNLVMNAGSSITTLDGTVSLIANDDVANFGGTFIGIQLIDADITTGDATHPGGNILLRGTGGDTGNGNVGVQLDTGSTITSQGTGATAATITLGGTGGPGLNDNSGVAILDSQVSSIDGDILVTGVSTGTGVNNTGVTVERSVIQSTGTGSGAARIHINGTGGTGTDLNAGVWITDNNVIAGISGDILITGVGRGTGLDNYGVAVMDDSRVESRGSTDIILVGNGGATGLGRNAGVFLNGNSIIGDDSATVGDANGDGSGHIIVDAGNDEFRMESGAIVRANALTGQTARIVIAADQIELDTSGVDPLIQAIRQGTGLAEVVLAPDNGDSVAINLGVGANGAGGFALEQTELNAIEAPVVVIGLTDVVRNDVLETRTNHFGASYLAPAVPPADLFAAAARPFASETQTTITVVAGGFIADAAFATDLFALTTRDSANAILTDDVVINGSIDLATSGAGRNFEVFAGSDITQAAAAKVTTGDDGTDDKLNSASGLDSAGVRDGDVFYSAERTITINGDAVVGDIRTTNGEITLLANDATQVVGPGATLPSTGNFTAITLVDADLRTGDASLVTPKVGGNMLIRGTGGNSGAANVGVQIQTGSTIASQGSGASAGTVTIDGTGGPGTNGNRGVSVVDSRVSSQDGDIEIDGRSDGTGTGNIGVFLFNAIVESTGTTADAAAISIDGAGGPGTNDNRGVQMRTNSLVTSEAGDIEIIGTSQGTGDENTGVQLEASTVESTGTATVLIDGTGGPGTDFNFGVELTGAAQVTGDSGDIEIRGRSNGTGDFNVGVVISDGSTVESSGTGGTAANVTIDGTGGAGVDHNIGVLITGTGTQVTSEDGDIRIEGDGGSNAATGRSFNDGIQINDQAVISSTGTTADAATVTILGQGGTAASGTGGRSTIGVRISDANTVVTSIVGDIQITGTAGAASNSAVGSTHSSGVEILNAAVVSSTGSGALDANVIIIGNGAAGVADNYGVLIDGANTVVSAKTGEISITGTAGTGAGLNNTGVRVTDNAVVETTGTAGNIAIDGTGRGSGDEASGVNVDTSAQVRTTNGNVVIDGRSTASGTSGHGVIVQSNAVVSAGGSGLIDIEGTSTTSAAGSGNGVVITTNALVDKTGVTGAVSITGRDGVGGNDAAVVLNDAIVRTQTTQMTITGVNQDVVMNQTVATNGVRSNSGDALIQSSRNVLLGIVHLDNDGAGAQGTAFITADADTNPAFTGGQDSNCVGEIIDNLTLGGLDAVHIVADMAVLRAGSGIGNFTYDGSTTEEDKDIDLEVATLSAWTCRGDIYVTELDDLVLSANDGLTNAVHVDPDAGHVGDGGDILVRAGGTVDIDDDIVNDGPGSITVASGISGVIGEQSFVNADVTALSGDVRLVAFGSVEVLGNSQVTTGGGDVELHAGRTFHFNETLTAGAANVDVILATDAAVNSGGGDVILTATDDVLISRVTAAGATVYVVADSDNSGTGEIVDNRTGEGAGNVNVTASNLSVRAASGIGADDALDTDVTRLAAVTDHGSLQVDDVSSLVIGTVSGRAFSLALTDLSFGETGTGLIAALSGVTISDSAGLGADVQDGGGDFIGLQAQGSITVNASNAVRNLDAGNITLDANSGGVTLNAAVDSRNDGGVFTGTVRISATSDVEQSAAGVITADVLGVRSTDGHVNLLTAQNDVNTLAIATVGGDIGYRDADGFHLSRVTAQSDADFNDATLFTVTSGLTTIGNTVRLVGEGGAATTALNSITQDGALGAINAAALGIRMTGGDVLLDTNAGAPAINDVNTLAVFVREDAAGRGGSVEFSDVDDLTIGQVSALDAFAVTTGIDATNNITVCSEDDLTLTRAVTTRNAATVTANPTDLVRLHSDNGDVSQTVTGTITTASLGVAAGADIHLSAAPNDVDLFSAQGIDVTFHDEDDVTIGSVTALACFPGVVGVIADDFTICTGGAFTITDLINVSDEVRIEAAGDVTQTAAILARALGINTSAGGSVTLAHVNNDVDVLAVFTDGGTVTYNDTDDLTIDHLSAYDCFDTAVTGVTTPSAAITITTGGNLTVDDAVATPAEIGIINADRAGTNLATAVVTVTSAAAIIDGSSGLNGDGEVDVIGHTVTLTAQTGIGSDAGLLGDAGDLDINATVLTVTNNVSGHVQLFEVDDVGINTISNLTRTVVLEAAGEIADADSGNEAVANITARHLALRAGTGIGNTIVPASLAADLDLAVTNLSASTTIGEIHVSNSLDLNITTVGGQSGVFNADANGLIQVVGAGDLNVLRAVTNAGVGTTNLIADQDINASAVVSAQGGAINLLADEDVNLAVTGDVLSNGGNVSIIADADGTGGAGAGSLFMADNGINSAIVNAGAGTVLLRATNNVTLGGVVSTNDTAAAINVVALEGAIIDGGDTAVDLTAENPSGVVTLLARSGIGSGNPLETNVAHLVATVTAAGSIEVDETSATGLELQDVRTANGFVRVNSVGTIVATRVDTTATQNDTNDITLTTTGAGADILVTQVLAGPVNDVELTAADDILNTGGAPASSVVADDLVFRSFNNSADGPDAVSLRTNVQDLSGVVSGPDQGNVTIIEVNHLNVATGDTTADARVVQTSNGSITLRTGGNLRIIDAIGGNDDAARVSDVEVIAGGAMGGVTLVVGGDLVLERFAQIDAFSATLTPPPPAPGTVTQGSTVVANTGVVTATVQGDVQWGEFAQVRTLRAGSGAVVGIARQIANRPDMSGVAPTGPDTAFYDASSVVAPTLVRDGLDFIASLTVTIGQPGETGLSMLIDWGTPDADRFEVITGLVGGQTYTFVHRYLEAEIINSRIRRASSSDPISVQFGVSHEGSISFFGQTVTSADGATTLEPDADTGDPPGDRGLDNLTSTDLVSTPLPATTTSGTFVENGFANFVIPSLEFGLPIFIEKQEFFVTETQASPVIAEFIVTEGRVTTDRLNQSVTFSLGRDEYLEIRVLNANPEEAPLAIERLPDEFLAGKEGASFVDLFATLPDGTYEIWYVLGTNRKLLVRVVVSGGDSTVESGEHEGGTLMLEEIIDRLREVLGQSPADVTSVVPARSGSEFEPVQLNPPAAADDEAAAVAELRRIDSERALLKEALAVPAAQAVGSEDVRHPASAIEEPVDPSLIETVEDVTALVSDDPAAASLEAAALAAVACDGARRLKRRLAAQPFSRSRRAAARICGGERRES